MCVCVCARECVETILKNLKCRKTTKIERLEREIRLGESLGVFSLDLVRGFGLGGLCLCFAGF